MLAKEASELFLNLNPHKSGTKLNGVVVSVCTPDDLTFGPVTPQNFQTTRMHHEFNRVKGK